MEVEVFEILLKGIPPVLAIAGAWWNLKSVVQKNSEDLKQLRSDNTREHQQVLDRLDNWAQANTREHDQLGAGVNKLRDDLNELDKQNSLEHEKLKNGTL